MATLSIGHSFQGKTCSTHKQKSKKCSRILISIYCQSRVPIDLSRSETKKEKEKKDLLPKLFHSVEEFGDRLKDNLSPKQKGDWKDLTLMSLSFSVYVYISQKIVCAYCVWMSMLKQHW
ncbi:Glycerol-3-phosphate acyltransferase [Actinidia chinensis var. chinensis]|uniref:Glycerol-3-phosphate acyltransferase n=1 Tax=Actinidia chinensis var. chinensis TaxID=1590841 RepID=A0A2R6RAB0_ACTCC|nr:Glycerol-3-phosphate acyltransferase [Actinidia chinensis var. chinensis]